MLPIGISFFTFHAISYVVDVYRRDAVAQKGPVEAALYLLLFPQLIAGPIVRYRDIAAQLAARAVGRDDFAIGIRRFVIGLGKKMLIANIVAGPADRLFALPPARAHRGARPGWRSVCYTLQIYFDFSGYSDMAIGLARMFGFRFPENFRYPYAAAVGAGVLAPLAHLALGLVPRLLYVPLGGNRVPPRRVYLNLVTVFFLCGLWHGASWTFVVWGLFHGAFLVLERARARRRVLDARAAAALRHLYALVVVMVGWVFFRADVPAGGGRHAAGDGGREPGAAHAVRACRGTSRRRSMLAIARRCRRARCRCGRRVAGAPGAARRPDGPDAGAAAIGAAVAALAADASRGCVMLIAAHTYNPFIYFRF